MRDIYFFYVSAYRIVNSEHLPHMEIVSGNEITMNGSVVSCSGRLFPAESGKEYPDIPKVCY